MVNKPKKEPTKKQDKIWLIIELSIGTVCLIEWIIQLLFGGTFSIIIVAAIIAYASAIKPAMRLIGDEYKTDNPKTKVDADKG
jgi:hypothetical protein